MPYLMREERDNLNAELYAVSQKLNELGHGFGADLNFCIHRLVGLAKPGRYSHWQEIIGALECAKQEIYRAHVGPYEATKMAEPDRGPVF